MREFLITKFVCAKCGTNLQLTYNTPKVGSFHSEGEPTGALMVENRIALEPCETCMKPLEEMKSVVQVLMGSNV